MAHSPGTWMAYPPEFSPLKCWTVQNDCSLNVTIDGGDTGYCRNDARLIAAAPELLEALRVAAFALKICFPSGQEPEWVTAMHKLITRVDGSDK